MQKNKKKELGCMRKGLVSIIIPCYNVEKCVNSILSSVLKQTYDNIELIIVDDGSTDNTANIIKGFEQRFTARGYEFRYVYQPNKGLGGAINTGLKYFTGEFLCWPDADDYLEDTSVQQRVEFLNNNLEYAVVTSDAYIRECYDLNNYKGFVADSKKNIYEENQFEYLLKEDGIFCSGCHMIRTSAFLDVNPNRSIYPARRGQNWQMLLPVYYKYKAKFLDIPLYNYIDYPSSMSKNKAGLDYLINRYNEHENILVNTLESIQDVQCEDLSVYLEYVYNKYCRLKMTAALFYSDYKLFDRQFKMKVNFGLDFRDVILLLRRYLKIVNKLYLKTKKKKRN